MNSSSSSGTAKSPPCQKSFWQAITVGDLSTVRCLLEHKQIDLNMYDGYGEQRAGCSAIHLAILEMPTWKGSEGRNGIQTEAFVREFFKELLRNGADIERVCNYRGEWYLQTAAGKTKSFFPEGYDALGLVLQFLEITRGAEVIANDVTRRLELIRDMLLEHMEELAKKKPPPLLYEPSLAHGCEIMYTEQKHCDVELRCGGRTFHAHRVILAARSKVFDAMFSVRCSESLQKVVNIKEVNPDAFDKFLLFLYTDKVDAIQDATLTQELLVLANRYDVHALKERCAHALSDVLSIENAAALLSIADESQSFVLKQRVLDFISENISEVQASDDFRGLEADLVREVLDKVVGGRPKKRAKCEHGVAVNANAVGGAAAKR